MKKLVYSIAILLLAGVWQGVSGQCSGGSNAGSVTPTTVFQTVNITAGTYRSFSATAGNSYVFSFCQGGGSASFDSQLTILTNSGAYAGGYSDDFCSTASEVTWTCTSSGNYRVLCNEYYCTSSSSSGTLAYRMFVPGPGANCSNPHVIGSLPFTATGLTTCGAGDDYNSSHACSSSYTNGEDYVFRYVASGPMDVRITLSNTLSYTGIFVTQGCPSTGTCISPITAGSCGGGTSSNESSSGNPVATFSLPSSGTYYFFVDTWPSPNCTPFDINVQQVPASAGGPGCGAYALSTPAYSPDNFNSGTLLTFPDDEFSGVVPLPFTFCFMGVNYTSLVVSSNAYVSFNSGCAGQYSGWDTDVIPSPAYANSPEAANSIMFPWVDVDPSVGGSIRYNTYGTAPNRRFVVAFRNVPMFSSSCNSMTYTGQVVLYETSFIIDIYVQTLPNCASWNNGEAVLGLLDASGTVAVPVPGYNNTVYTLTNFARRFTPNCPTCNVVLPAGFAEIRGVHENNRNRINWETNYELDAANFTLERSANGLEFQAVGQVPSQGSSPQGHSYQMVDQNPFMPLSYYRVVQRDLNGNETTSDVIVVSSTADGIGITGIRTDAEGFTLTMYSETVAADVKLELMDLTGRVVSAWELDASAGSTDRFFSMAGMRAGAYLVRLSAENGHQVVRKFVWR